jgi:NAD kinase
MKLNRVIVVYKKPAAVRGGHVHRKGHLGTIETVQRILREEKIPYRIILRDKLESMSPNRPPRADLIITIGGDGTVLSASHFAGNASILGVNSSPKTSVGFFCAANAKNFRKVIAAVGRSLIKPTLLPLLEVSLDGKQLPFLALNDVLFASASPAETVQYTLRVGRKKERQRGSGVWIAAGPGSTAGICSAGGTVTNVASRRIQYLARELYPIPGVRYRLRRGFASPGGTIGIDSEISHGVAFLDGAKLTYPLKRGATLSVRVSRHRLRIFLGNY